MGWVKRQRGGRYYVRSVRMGDKVTSFYYGIGPLAKDVATLDALKRAEREARLQEQARVDQIEAQLEALNDLCEDLVQASMEGAGYHRHRGQWRRYRSRPAQAVSPRPETARIEEVQRDAEGEKGG